MRNAVTTIVVFLVLALISYAALAWLVPAISSGPSSSPSGFNYGTSFVGPLSRDLAPWLAIIIAALGPVTLLRAATDNIGRGTRRRRR
jgi:hypothetical protein